MKAVFRCDASQEIGSGHAYRCMALAHALKDRGAECMFAVNGEAVTIVPQLADHFPVMPADGEQPCDVLVVDHYGLDAAYERAARGWASRIFVIDDLADRAHDCDVLLDQTYGRDADDYRGLVPEHCAVLAGAEYSLLRPEFSERRAQSLERRTLRHYQSLKKFCTLISPGSANYKNVTGLVLEALKLLDVPVSVDVVIGSGAKGYEKVAAQVESMKAGGADIRLLTQVHNMAELMMSTDVAIGAAGTSSWERCCMGVPTMVLVLADNQEKTAEELEKAGAVLHAGHIDNFDARRVAGQLSAFLQDWEALQRMSEKAAAICDGRGLQRVLSWLYPAEKTRTGHAVRLRMMEAADEKPLLALQSYPETRRYARNPQVPDPEGHARWMQGKLADARCFAYMILRDAAIAGHVRLDKREGGVYEVSILINPAFYGEGLAKAALAFLHRLHPGLTIVAEILPENAASQKLFEAAGYRRMEGNWYRYG